MRQEETHEKHPMLVVGMKPNGKCQNTWSVSINLSQMLCDPKEVFF
jgi:hypothetical protein